MSQRTTEWLCYVLALYAGSFWSPTRAVTVRAPPGNPATVEAQAKFFQDFFSVQLSPYKIEFGHVCEDPNTWEQRYEKKDFKNHRDMGKNRLACASLTNLLFLFRFASLLCRYRHLPTSEDFDQGHRLGSEHHFTERHERSRPKDGLFSAKVRWGDKKGGYGEHYWDLNHAGHAHNHGDDGYDGSDDGSYHEEANDPYDEPSENSPSYGAEEYDPEKASYEETGRAKRAHPKIKVERKHSIETYEDDQPQLKRKKKEQLQTSATHQVETKDDNKKRRYQHHSKEQDEEEYEPKEEKKQVVLVVSHKDKDTERQPSQFVPKTQPNLNQYVPYEGGAGVRQHQQPEVSAAESVPRLFLEPSTGHVVDRNTGQAYILQPISNTY